MQLEHFVITRFNYRGKGAQRHLDGANWNLKQDPLNSERLALRFKLFVSTCLPSILAQTNQNFTWILVIDKALQPQFRARLEELIKEKQRAHLHLYNPAQKLGHLDWLSSYMQSNPDYVLTTNLDDDDALPDNFIDTIQNHIFTTHQADSLPPIKTLGAKQIMQWDMITSHHAPLGWRSPWHRAQKTSSCGFSLLCKYPEYPFNVLGAKHDHAEHYFNLSTPAKDTHVELCRAAFNSAAKDNNDSLEHYPANTMFFDLSMIMGPVLMSNHSNNAQKWRLYEKKNERTLVTGPDTFPNISVDLEKFRCHTQDFRTGFKSLIKTLFSNYLQAKKRRRITAQLKART